MYTEKPLLEVERSCCGKCIIMNSEKKRNGILIKVFFLLFTSFGFNIFMFRKNILA